MSTSWSEDWTGARCRCRIMYGIEQTAADVERSRAILAAMPKPRTAHVRTLDPLLEHVGTRGYAADDPLARLSGIPIYADETVEPGWLELREPNGDVVARVRLA